MKLKGYIDNTYYVWGGCYFILCLVLSGLVIVLNVNEIYLTLGIIMLVITALMMWHFYVRCYELDKKGIKIRVGFFTKTYHYRDIKKSYITTNNRISYAMSKKRIAINFKNGKEIFISPEKMDEALLKIINNTGGKRK